MSARDRRILAADPQGHVPRYTEVAMTRGEPGVRYSASQVATSWGIDIRTVTGWIAKGWLRASQTTHGYRIRLRALRRLLLDHPSAYTTIAEADTARRRRAERVTVREPAARPSRP